MFKFMSMSKSETSNVKTNEEIIKELNESQTDNKIDIDVYNKSMTNLNNIQFKSLIHLNGFCNGVTNAELFDNIYEESLEKCYIDLIAYCESKIEANFSDENILKYLKISLKYKQQKSTKFLYSLLSEEDEYILLADKYICDEIKNDNFNAIYYIFENRLPILKSIYDVLNLKFAENDNKNDCEFGYKILCRYCFYNNKIIVWSKDYDKNFENKYKNLFNTNMSLDIVIEFYVKKNKIDIANYLLSIYFQSNSYKKI
jgi:hypothetical protein